MCFAEKEDIKMLTHKNKHHNIHSTDVEDLLPRLCYSHQKKVIKSSGRSISRSISSQQILSLINSDLKLLERTDCVTKTEHFLQPARWDFWLWEKHLPQHWMLFLRWWKKFKQNIKMIFFKIISNANEPIGQVLSVHGQHESVLSNRFLTHIFRTLQILFESSIKFPIKFYLTHRLMWAVVWWIKESNGHNTTRIKIPI